MHRGSLRVNVALLDSRMFVAAAFFVWDSEWGVFFQGDSQTLVLKGLGIVWKSGKA